MFKKNDKALIAARIIILAVICIFAAASLAVGIALAVVIRGELFLVSFAGLFMCWLMWVFSQLLLSYLCDIKLIRNKLYEESNANLEVFLKAANKRSNSLKIRKEQAEAEAELEHLQQLLSSGVITNDEYEKCKKELAGRR